MIAADYHLFRADGAPHLLLVDGSRLYAIEEALAGRLGGEVEPSAAAAALAEAGLGPLGFVDQTPLPSPPVAALSLAVAQRCNLGCTYCYAEGGDFGGASAVMPWPVAKASVRRLLASAEPGSRAHLSFLGGEPLANRAVLRRAATQARRWAARRRVTLGLSITTNGTLLTPEDGAFFERHGFAVTVSLDGIGADHDRLRPTKGGAPTFERIVARVRPLLAMQRRMQVGARVTVTPDNLDLRRTLDGLVAMGFDSVGFSPLLHAPSGRGEMDAASLAILLDQMIACGRECERRILAGERYPFANLLTALREIHRGTHRPYPCGAGAGYLGVSAQGRLFACHRFVDDEAAAMGSVAEGVAAERQARWLAERRVEQQTPCQTCWARYLCGGGCHYEVIHRGRPACDYIRGWLDYALGAYVRLSERCPSLFRTPGP